jgi:methyl-accepting chemotaxis protein
MKDVIIPSFIQQAMNYTLKHEQFFRYQSLVFSVYVINIIRMLGEVISKIIFILYRVLLEPAVTAVIAFVKNSTLFSDTSASWRKKRKLQHQREKLRKQQLAFQEESFDDFLNFVEEEASVIKQGNTTAENQSASISNVTGDVSRISDSVTTSRRTYKSFKEDLKSLKGTKQDIEKLKLFGYHKYRYVSKEFLARNKLKKESPAED